MKITREMIDNEKTIIHINYSKKEVSEARKRAEEQAKKYAAEHPAPVVQEQTEVPAEAAE